MNAEATNRRTKLIICCCIAFLALCITVYGLSRLLSARINNFVDGITDKITEQIGYPITIDKVSTSWDFIYLKVRLKNLTIFDSVVEPQQATKVPLFMASELVCTVDALNSLRTFSVKFKHILLRSPRLVLQWNGVGPPSVLGLGHENVSGDFNPELVLKLLGQQRRVTIENGDFHLEGKSGADLPLMGVKVDFHNLGSNEYSILARGTVAAAVQPEFVIAAKYHGDLSDFATAMINFEVRTSNIQLAEIFNFIPKYRQNIVQGDFLDFDLKGTIQNGTIRTINNEFNISKVTIAKDTIISGGSGNIEFTPGSNKYHLHLQDLSLANEALFSQPINVDSITSDIIYQAAEDDPGAAAGEEKRQIYTKNAKIKLMEMELTPELHVELNANNVEALELNAALSDASVRKLLVLMPDKKMPLPVSEWFKKALISGSIDTAKINYAPQKFSWSLGFKNTEIKFSHLWPSVYDIDAVLEMNNGDLKVISSKAFILGEQLRALGISFQDYQGKPYMQLKVMGSLDTNLEACMNYIKQTPLQDTLGAKLEPLNPIGNAGLDLQLTINLAQANVPVQFVGEFDLHQSAVQAPELNLTLSDITGKIIFSNDKLRSEGLQLKILNQLAMANLFLTDSKPRKLNLSLTTSLNAASISTILPKLKLDNVSGTTNVVATVELPWNDEFAGRVLNITSDLQGININYPAPFNKSANSKLPLMLQYGFGGNETPKVRLKLGDLIDGILFFKNQKMQGGRIAINTKLDLTASNDSLQIVGNLKQFDWDVWQPLLNVSQNENLPLFADLYINSLRFHGEQYESLRIKYNSAKKELFVDSPIITGTLALSQDEDRIEIKLNKLVVPEQRVKSNDLLDFVQKKRAANNLPMLQFSCEDLRVKKLAFKKVNLELLPRPYGYEIINFSFNNEHLLLQSQGRWQMDNKHVTTLAGTAQTQNFGKVLAEWGYRDSMTRGKGEINFAVQWDGAPSEFNLYVIQGSSHMDMRSGSLTQVNPGLGRIIGLLSLESIQRRLQLDFSDLLSKGFAFDKFVADMELLPGSIASDNILINSPSAKIELFGKTGIKSRELDFTMYVTPKVGASLPIAAAIAAGPAVGAAIWLFDKASGSKLSEITKYKYRVTGTWDKPQIDEVSEGTPKNAT